MKSIGRQWASLSLVVWFASYTLFFRLFLLFDWGQGVVRFFLLIATGLLCFSLRPLVRTTRPPMFDRWITTVTWAAVGICLLWSAITVREAIGLWSRSGPISDQA